MKMSAIYKYLQITISEGIPVCLVGAPGIGKTSVVRQVCAFLAIRLIEIHPIEWETIDFKGFPVVENGVPRFVPYGEMKEILESSERIVLLFDDLGHGKIDVLKAIMQIFRGRLGENLIPSNVYIMGATNDTTDKAGVAGMPEPLKSSMVLVNVEHNATDSLAFAEQNGWEDELIKYLQFNPEEWHKPAPTMKLVKSPCPREWERINSHLVAWHKHFTLGTIEKSDLKDVEFGAYKGCIGEDAAMLFIAQIEAMRLLPLPLDVLESADTIQLPLEPENMSVLYILCTTVAGVFQDETFRTDQMRHQAWKFVERLPEVFQRLTISKLFENDDEFTGMVQANHYRVMMSQNMVTI